MLNLIEDRLNRNVFDDVMEVAWSTMWNVTDETAVNCERFLDGQGMTYFLKCLKVTNDKLIVAKLGFMKDFFTDVSRQGRIVKKHDGITGKCCRSPRVATSFDDARIYYRI